MSRPRREHRGARLPARDRRERLDRTGSTSARSPRPADAGSLAQAALAPGQQQRRLAQPAALQRPLPEAVTAGPVAGGGRVEADRPRPRPQQRGGGARVDHRARRVGEPARRRAARRAASAHARSVRASVRTGRGGAAAATATLAPGPAQRPGELVVGRCADRRWSRARRSGRRRSHRGSAHRPSRQILRAAVDPRARRDAGVCRSPLLAACASAAGHLR